VAELVDRNKTLDYNTKTDLCELILVYTQDSFIIYYTFKVGRSCIYIQQQKEEGLNSNQRVFPHSLRIQ